MSGVTPAIGSRWVHKTEGSVAKVIASPYGVGNLATVSYVLSNDASRERLDSYLRTFLAAFDPAPDVNSRWLDPQGAPVLVTRWVDETHVEVRYGLGDLSTCHAKEFLPDATGGFRPLPSLTTPEVEPMPVCKRGRVEVGHCPYLAQTPRGYCNTCDHLSGRPTSGIRPAVLPPSALTGRGKRVCGLSRVRPFLVCRVSKESLPACVTEERRVIALKCFRRQRVRKIARGGPGSTHILGQGGVTRWVLA